MKRLSIRIGLWLLWQCYMRRPKAEVYLSFGEWMGGMTSKGELAPGYMGTDGSVRFIRMVEDPRARVAKSCTHQGSDDCEACN